MSNIGCVLYTKGDEPGSLNATWCHSEDGYGTGKAMGGPDDGYAGRYRILYFDQAGEQAADRELEIKKTSDTYELAWIKDGEIRARGYGMETAEGLIAGWRNEEKWW